MLGNLLPDADAASDTETDTQADGETNGSARNGCADRGADRNAEHDTAHTATVADDHTDTDADTNGCCNAFGATRTCSGRFGWCRGDDRFVGVDLAPLLELKLSEPTRVPPLDSLLLMPTMTRV